MTLTIAGLQHCWSATDDLNNFMTGFTEALMNERAYQPSVMGGEAGPTLRSSELAKSFGMSPEALQRLYLYMRYEPWQGGGGTTADGWELRITRSIRRFRGVQTIEEYLDRRAEFFGQAARIPPAVRLGLKPGTVLAVEQEQKEGKYVFVIMPLKAEFDAVYKTIRAACGKFPGVTFDRADDWSQTGRITDQIINALKSADLVIAEITEQNANVMYELGYAHALEKKVIVLNATERSPFDVADYRQIRYAADDLASAEESLTRFVQSGLGIEPNR